MQCESETLVIIEGGDSVQPELPDSRGKGGIKQSLAGGFHVAVGRCPAQDPSQTKVECLVLWRQKELRLHHPPVPG